MILDYAESTKVGRAWRAMSSSREPEGDAKRLFYATRGFCPFCKNAAAAIHAKAKDEEGAILDPNESHYDADRGNPIRVSKAWQCLACGWWEVKNDYWYEVKHWGGYYLPGGRSTLIHGILRAFELTSNEASVAALRKYIAKKPRDICNISPRKMEELVQSVFRDYYDCEVRHCGRSYDGGVDLLLILSGTTTAVQVKRRLAKSKTESVSLVRELLGATLLGGYSRACFVTTASKFSRPAQQAASEAIRRDLVSSFDLSMATLSFKC